MPADPLDRALPSIDVVILTWNDPDLADAAISAATRSEGVVVHLHVVDNGSVVPYRAQPPLNLIRRPSNEGVAAGRNAGARAGTAPLICFIDSDAVVAPTALSKLSSSLTDPGVGMAVPVFSGQRPETSAGARPSVLRKVGRGLGLTKQYRRTGGPGPIWEVQFGIGACQMLRRPVFESVGGLDARYFFGPEDIDFCDRVRAAGWKIVQVEGADVMHYARRSHRNLLTRRGVRHAVALARFYAGSRRTNS